MNFRGSDSLAHRSQPRGAPQALPAEAHTASPSEAPLNGDTPTGHRPLATSGVLVRPPSSPSASHLSNSGVSESKPPLVSVVIPSRNRCESLADAVESVLGQTTAVSYELIVVDNNSTDDTRRVVERYQARERVTYVFEPYPGISTARNAGIKAAQADVIAFIDDDCRAGPDWITTIKKTFDEYADVSCIGGKVLPRWQQQPPPWLDRSHWSPLALTDYGNEPILMDASRPVCLICASLAFRRSVFDTVGLFSTKLSRSEDHELLLRFYNAGGKALYVPAMIATTEVPLDRCTKAYHRRWHLQHGRDCATMRLNERIGASGELTASDVPSDFLFLVPAYVYRDLLRAVLSWSGSLLHGRSSVVFHEEARLLYLFSYIRDRYWNWREIRTTSHASEVLSTARRLLSRKLRSRVVPAPATPPAILTNISEGERR